MDGFYVLTPVEITSAMVTATNLTESAAAWAGGTTYAEAAVVRYADHVWKSLQSGNVGHTPGDAASADWWFDTGATNPMRAFDASIQSQATRAGSFYTTLNIPIGEGASVVYFENLAASAVTLSIPAAGYEVELDLNDDSGVIDLVEYLDLPIRRRTWALVEKVPFYAGAITITVDNGADIAGCGDCVIARPDKIGETRWGAEIGFIDYTEKTADPNVPGGWKITPGDAVDTIDAEVWVRNNRLDFVRDTLIAARAKRRVYVLDDRWKATIINGFMNGNVRFVMEHEGRSLLSIPLASLS